MEKLESLEDILKEELKDLYSAEVQITKALPKVIKNVSSSKLKSGLEEHLKETEKQVARLEKISKIMNFKITGKTCKAMKGLIEEGEEIIKEMKGEAPLIDALLIGACQRIEHYEMAGYGTARAMAESLGQNDVVELLQETLDEEGAANETLTSVSESEILPECSALLENEEEEEEEPRSSYKKSMSKEADR